MQVYSYDILASKQSYYRDHFLSCFLFLVMIHFISQNFKFIPWYPIMIGSKTLIVKNVYLFSSSTISPFEFQNTLKKLTIGGLHNTLHNTNYSNSIHVFLEGVMALYYSGYPGYKNIDFTQMLWTFQIFLNSIKQWTHPVSNNYLRFSFPTFQATTFEWPICLWLLWYFPSLFILSSCVPIYPQEVE